MGYFKTYPLLILAGIIFVGCGPVDTRPCVPTVIVIDSMTIDCGCHYVDGIEPIIDDEWVRMVVEIPTGTIAKWEVNKTTGDLEWEIRNGALREVNYLGYPGNYGMIPRTLLDKSEGGDGDPLDVICLGKPVERGSVNSVKLIGVLKLLDRGEQDDKLIAVPESSHFEDIDSLEELEQHFTGTLSILETWFTNYKGPGKMEFLGFGERAEARRILEIAIESYSKRRHGRASLPRVAPLTDTAS